MYDVGEIRTVSNGAIHWRIGPGYVGTMGMAKGRPDLERAETFITILDEKEDEGSCVTI